ncbi:hypothetical protein EGW08_020151 [Elysia chlorotica]|uniref:Calpain catalytic domain-containing protein n=1 Tax=Elysia chlorotica TaxID=188477 RepID=A0A3S1AU21_ELYCH|nr:hypothetical protein EGW08_020151 [Elysia chlorotica]
MGCSASVESGVRTWPSRSRCCAGADAPIPSHLSSGAATKSVATPRNWTSLTENLQVLKRRKQLEGRKLFIDSQFPPKEISLGTKQDKYAHKKIVWKRPHELSLHPVLIADGTSRHDMKQGDLNDCWFLSTLSLVAEKPQLISKIIQADPNFGSTEYSGIFHCRFWQFGSWTEVFVDDLLPTVDGNLLFARSSDPNEFWVSLVEKAYAKLNKSYAALEYGFEADAYTDLTGGLAEWYTPAALRENDFYLMRAAFQCGAVIGCLSVDRQDASGKKGPTRGMVPNHSYVVTGAAEVPYVDVAVKLIRMRNPWGDTEWQGEWCDGGDEWKRVPETIKRELEVTSKDDGEFWMSFGDFRREYSNMIICNMSPDFDHDGISDKAAYQLLLKGRWEADRNAGGWLECDTFHLNPQYQLVVYHDAHVERRYNGRHPLVVALLQVYKRGVSRLGEAEDLYAVGFEIFQLSESASTTIMEPLDNQFFQSMDPLMPENQETYAKYRETSGRFFLYPGRYLLVPSTHEPNQSRDYVLRLFSVGKIECGSVGNIVQPSSTS